MKKLLLASAALMALSFGGNAVQAADMPVKVAKPVPVFSWSGCYVGVQVGYKWGTQPSTPALVTGTACPTTPGSPAGYDITRLVQPQRRASAVARPGARSSGAPGCGASRSTARGRRPKGRPIDIRHRSSVIRTVFDELDQQDLGALARHRSRPPRLRVRQVAVVRDRRRRLDRLRHHRHQHPCAFRRRRREIQRQIAAAGSSASAPNTHCRTAGRSRPKSLYVDFGKFRSHRRRSTRRCTNTSGNCTNRDVRRCPSGSGGSA